MSLRTNGNRSLWSRTAQIGALLLLLISGLAVAQVPTPVRSVSSLPATCNGGTATTESDMVTLISAGGIGQQYTCSATNVWSPTSGFPSVNALAYGVKADGQEVFDATVTISTTLSRARITIATLLRPTPGNVVSRPT